MKSEFEMDSKTISAVKLAMFICFVIAMGFFGFIRLLDMIEDMIENVNDGDTAMLGLMSL